MGIHSSRRVLGQKFSSFFFIFFSFFSFCPFMKHKMNLLVVFCVLGTALMTRGIVSATVDAELNGAQEDFVRAAENGDPKDVSIDEDDFVEAYSPSDEGEEKSSKLSRLIRQVRREKRLYENDKELEERYKKAYEKTFKRPYADVCPADKLFRAPCVDKTHRVDCIPMRGVGDVCFVSQTYGSMPLKDIGMLPMGPVTSARGDQEFVKCYGNADCVRYYKNGYYEKDKKTYKKYDE